MKCPKCQTENPNTVKFCGECGANITPADDAQPSITKTIETPREELTTGSTFAGRYQIIEELGKGGMGKVYKALDIKINEKIAVKLIRPEIASDKKIIERFSNELKMARKISHRNVGRMFHIEEYNGTHFITMEYVPGEDLKSFVHRSGQLAISKALSIAKQICAGLAEAHSLGVVHRDLKPSNIMIDKDGNVRIMDFGIARLTTGKGITDKGVIIGTPEYISPEQAETKEVDHRSDIYSLGVILYEMVTGQRPFDGETALSIIRKHADEIPRDPKELNPQIPVELSTVILRCLDKQRSQRYQSAKEVLSALDHIENGIPSVKGLDTERALTSKEITLTFSLKRLMLPAIIVVALVIIAVLIRQLLPEKEGISGRNKPAIAVLPFDNFSPDPEDAYFANGMQEQLVSTLAKIRSLSVRGRTSVMRYRNLPKTPSEIAEELDVNYVLEGSARIVGNQVSITAILIDARNEEPLWSEEYDRGFSVDEVLSIHREIAEKVASQLKAVLTQEEHAQIEIRPTESLGAYQAYLKGRFFQAKRTQEDLAAGMDCFNDAIQADPTYAAAWAGLADSYIQQSGYGSIPAHVAIPKAREAVTKALELDPDSGEAHLSNAWINFHNEKGRRDHRPEYEKALELSPDLSTAYHWYGWYLICLHQYEDGIALLEIALDLDPLVSIYNATFGYFLMVTGELDAAIKQLETTLELDHTFPRALWWLGQALVLNGEMEGAIEYLSQAVEFSGSNPQYLATLAWAYGVAGEQERAYQIIQELELEAPSRYVPHYDLAVAYIGAGDTDRALTALEDSVRSNDSWLCWISVDPRFAPVRDAPRFTAVLKFLGYENPPSLPAVEYAGERVAALRQP